MFKYIAGGFVALALILGLGYMNTYNGLVRLDQGVEQSIANVQVDLQRQANLLPELARVAERGVTVETQFQTSVVQARAQAMGVMNLDAGEIARNPELQRQLFESQQQMPNVLAGARIVFERYPDMQSQALYRTLVDEIAGSQNRVSYTRQQWNRATGAFNTAVRSFPGNLVAANHGFQERDFYEATASGQVEMPELGLPE